MRNDPTETNGPGLTRRAAAGSVLATGLVGRSLAQTAGSEPLRSAKLLSSDPTLTTSVVLVMQVRKFDRAHGLNVDVATVGGASSLMIEAVSSGSAEFGNPGTLTALQAIRQGAKIKIIGSIANNQLTAVINNVTMKKLGVTPTAPIEERMRVLKGLTIGTNPLGSSYYQMTRNYLRQYGLDPDKDARVVGVGDTSALLTGLVQGRFDVIMTASGIVEQAIALDSGTMWFSCARGDIPGAREAIVSVVVARTDFVEKRAADVDAFRAALGDALDLIHNDHDATGLALKSAYFPKMDQRVWDLAWATTRTGFPTTTAFPREAYDYWVANDPKGADAFKDMNYANIVYGPAQGS